MSVSRQDAWTQDEDLILAEIVLRHIREGSTQLIAFEEVGKKLSRTPAACGFRWNSFVRKQYAEGIELAKKQRKENKKTALKGRVEETRVTVNEEGAVSAASPAADKQGIVSRPFQDLESVIAFLESLKEGDAGRSEKERKLQEEVDILVKDKERMILEISILKEKLSAMEEDYRALIEIMDKARKLVILEENKKVKFQMDKNGNLEPVRK